MSMNNPAPLDLTVSTSEIYRGTDFNHPLEPDLKAMEKDISALKNPGTVPPLLTVDMRLGRLDNNSGGEFPSTSRICCDSIPVTVGTTYWQANTKGVSMYVLLYGADETFVQFVGSVASGGEFAVSNADAVYMRMCSLVGEYDLTNTFNLYDEDPANSGVDPSGSYTKEESDSKYAVIGHGHTNATITDGGYMSAEDKVKLDGMTSGGGTPVDVYTKTESDAKYEVIGTAYSKTESDSKYALLGADGGATGPAGADGKSAYEVAVSGGFTGTEVEWLASLKGDNGATGPKGDTGATGSVGPVGPVGPVGATGAVGQSGPKGDPGRDGTEISAADVLSKMLTVDGMNSGLDADLLDGHHSTDFAMSSHVHNDYAPVTHAHNEYAPTTHTHNDYSNANHTHTAAQVGAAATTHTHSDYANSNHSHTASQVGAAPTNHTHTASQCGAASSSHSHSEYAGTNHSHSGQYASYSHDHGSTYSMNGHQHSSFGSLTTGDIRTDNIYPNSNNNYNIGGYSNRYTYIYSVNALQTGSDERIKHDIVNADNAAMVDFVGKIDLKKYKYNDDPDNKERLGVTAQQLISINPEIAKFVVTTDENGYYGIGASDLVFPLIAAVQKLTNEVEALKNK